MTFHPERLLRALLLGLLSAVIFYLVATGKLQQFIHSEYIILTKAASLLFLIFFFLQVKTIWTKNGADDHDEMCSYFGCNHEKGEVLSFPSLFSYGILVVIICASLFLPIQTLDHSVAMNRTMVPDLQGNVVKASPHQQKELVLTNENFSEKAADITFNPTQYHGATITLTGMLHKAEGLERHQYIISRFHVTHCIADAKVIQFIVHFPELPHIHGEDPWIEMKGELAYLQTEDGLTPYIKVNSWSKVEVPENPYVK
ncbi:TIGR03943 family putative permease subunit [Alkalihalobacterium bogoriense]|uniref:TIGR03943 family putative permease subunit n=1 Tax=Alkalihalobacterium bogoriense TaxID=246272 RepID=UPI00047A7300|nr:TIGR03943 family protein [Alkalihalobacterium bogoriense]